MTTYFICAYALDTVGKEVSYRQSTYAKKKTKFITSGRSE
ncbi:hypothetical protein LINPERHAP1_LOCUS24562 [Linum perenne]